MASLEASMTELAARLPMPASWRSLARDTDMDVASVAKHVDEAGEKFSQQPQEPGERAPLPGKGNFMQQLQDALSADEVGLRTSAGQSFAQYLRTNPDAKAKCDVLKTPGETQRLKKEFRLNWAKDNLEAITVLRHRQEESWSRVHGVHVVYMPSEQIVQEEGGETSPAAVKAATLYAMKALAMGGEWIRYNVMTERTDILYLQYPHDSTFSPNWSRFLEAKGNGASLATEESEPSETNAKAAVLPVQIKESNQQPTAVGTSKRARESATPEPKAKKQHVETPDKLGTTISLREISGVAPNTCCKQFCRVEPT